MPISNDCDIIGILSSYQISFISLSLNSALSISQQNRFARLIDLCKISKQAMSSATIIAKADKSNKEKQYYCIGISGHEDGNVICWKEGENKSISLIDYKDPISIIQAMCSKFANLAIITKSSLVYLVM